MQPSDFWAIIADIDSHTEGDAFTVDIGRGEQGGYKGVAVERLPLAPSVVVLSQPDVPPLYLDIAVITGVQLNG